MESVNELTSTMTGIYRVTTVGSEHVWDLRPAARRYTRHPGPHSGSGASPGDDHACQILRVEAWPAVGGCFRLAYALREGKNHQLVASMGPLFAAMWRTRAAWCRASSGSGDLGVQRLSARE